jgi:hypothetical protein
VHLSVDPAPPLQETDTDRLQQLLMDETLPMFQRYRAMFSLRNKVNESRIENNAFLRLQMLWRVEKDTVTSDTDRLHQLLMDETLPLFQRYRAMFSLRNKVNKSRLEKNAFLRLQMLWPVEKDIVTSDTDRLQQLLMDETLPLFQRYRAMFSLRNKVNQSRTQLKRTSSRNFIRGGSFGIFRVFLKFRYLMERGVLRIFFPSINSQKKFLPNSIHRHCRKT